MRNTNGRRGRHVLWSWVATLALTGTLAGGILTASPRFHTTPTSTAAASTAPSTTATTATTASPSTTSVRTPISITFHGDDSVSAAGDN